MQEPMLAIAAPRTKALQEIGLMFRYGCLMDKSGERQRRLWMDFGIQFKSSLTYPTWHLTQAPTHLKVKRLLEEVRKFNDKIISGTRDRLLFMN